ncbi:lysophospholipase [bacterium]|nr:lysophospholipase [bacterium]
MYTRSETFFTGYDGTKLFLQKWIAQNAKGTILITHGQAEHSDCYQRLVNALDGQGWNFIAWDMRGHGKSEGLRGYAKDFDEYVLDYKIFLEKALELFEVHGKPVVLLAHSMGGLVQTCALAEKKVLSTNIAGQILSSPMFGVAIEVPEWKDKGAGFINSILPKVTLSNEIKNEQLTRDLDVIREYEQDTYRHGRISAGAYLGFKREFPRVVSKAADIHIPTLMHISDKDPVVSSEAALKFFDGLASTNKSLKIVEGGKHELYNDTVRVEVFKVVIDYLKQFTKN